MNRLTGNRIAENLSERGRLLKNYSKARLYLLFVIILTVVNIVLIVAGSDTYFPFSAIIPLVLGVSLSSIIHFDADLQAFIAEQNILPGTKEYEHLMSAEYAKSEKSFYAVLVAWSVIILGLYFVAWLCSKKPERKGYLIFALVLFVPDTAMVWLKGITMESVVDIVCHVFVLIYLIMGISAAAKLNKLKPEEPHVGDTVIDVSGPYVATPADEEIDPGFTYYENTTSTLNGESVDTKNEKL